MLQMAAPMSIFAVHQHAACLDRQDYEELFMYSRALVLDAVEGAPELLHGFVPRE